MSPTPSLLDIAAQLAPLGLNAAGIADGRPYSELQPGCRSVLVLGSGGPLLWERLRALVELEPRWLLDRPHPLDDFVARLIHSVDPDPHPSRRWLRCALDEPVQLDFRTLALQAGLGHHSRLGLLLHPRFGPWLGLRAACFSTEELPPTGPLPGPGPCPACPAPCAAACHGRAITADGPVEAAFSILPCSARRRLDRRCRQGCDARRACPIGPEHAYPELELHYHQDKRSGRRAWQATLGARAKTSR